MPEPETDVPDNADAAPDPSQKKPSPESDKLSAARMAGLGAPTATRFPGRNEPCLCGSGQKFKRCCGR